MTQPTLDIPALISAAKDAATRAYIPYSHYPVGAALVTHDGQIYTGCNIENAAFPAGICAERVALVKAVSEGIHDFDTVVVVTRDAGSPCGICRQMLFEFAPDMRVILADMEGGVTYDGTLRDLLPLGFGPEHLK